MFLLLFFFYLANISLVAQLASWGGGERVTVVTSSLFILQPDRLPVSHQCSPFSVGPVAVTESPAPFPVVRSSSPVA